MEIFEAKENRNFGDAWRIVSFCLLRSVKTGQPIGFNCFGDLNAARRIDEISTEMDSSGQVMTTNEPSQHHLEVNCWVPTVPTKVRWNSDFASKRIAYQFDGGWRGYDKNPPPEDQDWFLKAITDLGFEPVRLGGHQSVKQILQEASTCRFFIGACSGMVQPCYSLGIPVFVLKYNQPHNILDYWHRWKAVGFPDDLRIFFDYVFPTVVYGKQPQPGS